MIAGIRGTLRARTGDRVVIDTPSGIQYELAVPLGVLELPPLDNHKNHPAVLKDHTLLSMFYA